VGARLKPTLLDWADELPLVARALTTATAQRLFRQSDEATRRFMRTITRDGGSGAVGPVNLFFGCRK
jgi:hypothetical protein